MIKDNICMNCSNRNLNWYCELLKEDCNKNTIKCTDFKYIKTNFDIVTENPSTLARFMAEIDCELTMKDNMCRFCGQYEMLDEPSCHAKCSDGFKMWLEQGVK